MHTVSPAVAQVPRTACADETVAAFARFITDGDLAKRNVTPSLRRDKALRPCLLGLMNGINSSRMPLKFESGLPPIAGARLTIFKAIGGEKLGKLALQVSEVAGDPLRHWIIQPAGQRRFPRAL